MKARPFWLSCPVGVVLIAGLAAVACQRQGRESEAAPAATAAQPKEQINAERVPVEPDRSTARAEAPQGVASLAERKLDLSKNLLQALAVEDFGSLSSNARDLNALLADEAWGVVQNTEYAAHLEGVALTTGEMARLGDEKDLDGAAEAFTQLTMSCVNCHKYLRSAIRQP